MNIPDHLIYPFEQFAESYKARHDEGTLTLLRSKVAFVGLARNCAVRLAENLGRLEYLVQGCKEWALHIEENDSTDQTRDVLKAGQGRSRWPSTAMRASGGFATVLRTRTS